MKKSNVFKQSLPLVYMEKEGGCVYICGCACAKFNSKTIGLKNRDVVDLCSNLKGVTQLCSLAFESEKK